MDELNTRIETIVLDENTKVLIEALDLGGEKQVSSDVLDFEEVSGAIEKIAKTVLEPIKKAAPKKATVEFGLAVGLESGKLTALWVKGHGTAHLNIKLEWENI